MAIPSETGGIWLWVPMQALIPGHADQGPHPHGGADALERRADVVQVFPDHDSVTRLIGSVLLEQHEEWQHGERRYLSQTSLRRLTDILQADNSTGASASDRAALPAITT